MAQHLYYFRPSALSKGLGKLSDSYRVVPLQRGEDEQPAWELPAVLVADEKEDDLRSLERIAPQGDGWRLIFLLEGETPPRTRLAKQLFAVLPRGVSRAVLTKTLESAFEALRMEEDRQRTRRLLHDVASDLEALNKIGVALSSERNTYMTGQVLTVDGGLTVTF